jgi:hypothetical protein
MENVMLKNQKELYDNLPSAQLGSKFTKMANRFASKNNYPISLKLPNKNNSIYQHSSSNTYLLPNNLANT